MKFKHQADIIMEETPRILIAEDNPDHAELSKSILEKNFNCSVKITSNGKSCLEQIQANHHDILLLDYILPDCNGLSILKKINQSNINIAVIMITGQGDEKVAVQAMKDGAYDYIVKSTGYLITLPLIIKKAIEKHLLTIAQQKMKDQLVKQNKTLNILYQISSTLNKPKPFSALINDSLSKILKMMKLNYGAIFLNESLSGEVENIFCQGFDKDIHEHLTNHLLSDSFIDFFIKAKKYPVSFDEIVGSEFTKLYNNHLKNKHLYIYGLKLKQKLIGLFITGGRPLTQTDKNIFDSLLNQIVVVIERNLLLIEEKKAREFSENLRISSEIINSSLNIDEILNSILMKIVTYVKATSGAIFIFEQESNSFEAVYDYCIPDTVFTQLKSIDNNDFLHSIENSRHYKYNLDHSPPSKDSYKSFISVPITCKNRIIGIIDLASIEKTSFTNDDKILLKAISDQVSTAIDKAHLFEQVKQLKDFNENIVQSLEEGIIIENEKGEIVFSNPKMEKLVNLRQKEIYEKKLTDLVTSEYHDSIQNQKELIRSNQPCRFEATLIGNPHHQTVVQISCHPLFDGNNFRGSLSVFVDITEIKQLESQLLQSEKLSAIGQLVSGVAHELNNPLSSIMGLSKLLVDEIDLNKIQSDLDIIYKQGYRCHKIVENLLTFARKHTPEKTWTDIHDVINSVLDLHSFQFRKDDIHIMKKYNSAIPELFIDFHQFQQVFLNIFTNAYQALLKKSGKRIITICSDLKSDEVLISISDNGSGIPKSIISKIFDPFFTTKGTGEGTGLGLSICYGIVDNHEGHISAKNLPNGGACFNIQLPMTKRSPDHKPHIPAIKNINIQEKRILIIDDEQTIIDLLHRYLTREGHQVDVAQNGATALKKVKTNDYEVIISDLRMPGITGEILFDIIGRTAPELQRRMIFTTGDSDSPDAFHFLHTHTCRYLNKPFSFEDLKEAILDVCRVES